MLLAFAASAAGPFGPTALALSAADFAVAVAEVVEVVPVGEGLAVVSVCAGAGPCLVRLSVLWLWLEAQHAPLALAAAYFGLAVPGPQGHPVLWRQLACGTICNLLAGHFMRIAMPCWLQTGSSKTIRCS